MTQWMEQAMWLRALLENIPISSRMMVDDPPPPPTAEVVAVGAYAVTTMPVGDARKYKPYVSIAHHKAAFGLSGANLFAAT
jgi:hypothetical protein